MAYLLKSLLLSSFVSRVQASWAEAFGPANQKPIGGEGRGRPNIVFVLTDDQDLHMQSLDYMPFVQQHLIDQGTSFRKHFCTTALCCPSRVSLWTGKAAHNTNVTDVTPPHGTATLFSMTYQSVLKLTEEGNRRISEVYQSRTKRQISPSLVTERGIQHLLHWKALQCSCGR